MSGRKRGRAEHGLLPDNGLMEGSLAFNGALHHTFYSQSLKGDSWESWG